MQFFDRKNTAVDVWLPIIGGPILSLVLFLGIWWLDPFSLSQLSGIPAFFLSVIALSITQWLVTVREIQKTAAISDKIHDAVKNYLHVTPVGLPEDALRYIIGRLPAVREVMNTSFTLEVESERSDEKLYQTETYSEFSQAIANNTKHLLWKDIGDHLALRRLRTIHALCNCSVVPKHNLPRYKYKVINHSEPQMNFILLEYQDGGGREVLFNWDFRGNGQDPTVLISRDNYIVEMFTIHFNLLWRRASEDHDNQATISDSTQ